MECRDGTSADHHSRQTPRTGATGGPERRTRAEVTQS